MSKKTEQETMYDALDEIMEANKLAGNYRIVTPSDAVIEEKQVNWSFIVVIAFVLIGCAACLCALF